MKKLVLIELAVVFLMSYSCKKEDFRTDPSRDTQETAAYLSKKMYDQYNSGHIKIAVVSDIHFMDPSLLQNNAENGAAFKTYMTLNASRAMQLYSVPILDQFVAEIKYQKPDILLIAGDLSKNGEKVNHEYVAGALASIEEIGCKVYVVPGNNDVSYPKSVGYDGNTTYPVPNVSPTDFTTLYDDFGYQEAISRDPNSLSYVAEPFPGLRILAIDACKYNPYDGKGIVKPGTMQWMSEQLAIAKQNGILALPLMHHSLIDHMPDESDVYPPGNKLENWNDVVAMLTAAEVKVVFTGHGHANDIAQYNVNGKTIYDIETGSLIGPPCPYRMMVLKNKELDISSNYITTINATMPDGMSFVEYSDWKLSSLLASFTKLGLSMQPWYVPSSQRDILAPLGANAFKAQMAGDERISPEEQLKLEAMKALEPEPTNALKLFNSLWTDTGIKDNKWHIKLQQ